MNHTAEPIEVTPFPTWREQIGSWQQRLSAVDWLPWMIVGFAACLRLLLLGMKPPHFDEGINGWFVDQMVHNGFYRYDPTNYHGPLHFYVLFMFQTLLGRDIWALRLPVVIISITCVWLTLKFEPFVGRRISRWAAVAMAVSPGFVFYGRYSIHEVWMLLFSMLMVFGLLGLWRAGTRGYLWCVGMGLTGMVLTKETYLIHAGCAAIAILVVWISTRLPQPMPTTKKTASKRKVSSDLTILLGALTILSVFLPWASLGDTVYKGPVLYELGSAGKGIWIVLVAGVAVVVLSLTRKSSRLAGAAGGALQFFTIIYMCGHLPQESELGIGGVLNIILSIALLISALVSPAWNYAWKPAETLSDGRGAPQQWDYLDLVVVIGVGAILVVTFYSGTFLNWSGLKGIYEAYGAWARTGQQGQSGHEKPWGYWLKLLCRYEWPLLFGLAIALFAQWFKSVTLRYLAVYGVGTLIAYSIVKYKTPWCIISIVWPLLFTFGAAAVLVPKVRQRATEIAMVVLLCFSFGSSVYLNFFRCSTFASDDWDKQKSFSENLSQFFASEPYVYVQTYNDIFKLTRPALALAKRDPIYYQLTGHMIRTSSYPFPWIFDNFPNVGYYEHDNLPPKLDADFLLVQQDKIEEVEKKLQNSYFTEPLTIRPYQDTSKLYLDAKMFKEFFPNREPEFKGHAPGPG